MPKRTDIQTILILGSGPIVIGQACEFDYSGVQACKALRREGYRVVLVNSNPATIMTDPELADATYVEPLTAVLVEKVIIAEKPDAILPTVSGQTGLNLAVELVESGVVEKYGVELIGADWNAIRIAEDRSRFKEAMLAGGVPVPDSRFAYTLEEAREAITEIGYPALVRASFTMGGAGGGVAQASPGNPVLIDQFIEDAFEVDVDAVGDGEQVVVAGVMQHIEKAGVHSGDSACVLPPYKISLYHLSIIRDYTEKLGKALQVRGLMNAQFAIKDDVVYVREVNPHASRTVPFVSKATGVPVAKLAAQVQAGKMLAELGFTKTPDVDGFFVKEAVLPFNKFPGADMRLSPEVRSTGEVMGHAYRFAQAFAKAQMAAGTNLPAGGGALITVNDYDKSAALKLGRDLQRMGFDLYATEGTAVFLERAGLPVTTVQKAFQAGATSADVTTTVDVIADGTVNLIINTPLGQQAYADQQAMYAAAIRHGVPLMTTLSAAQAAVNGVKALRDKELTVRSLQRHHQD